MSKSRADLGARRIAYAHTFALLFAVVFGLVSTVGRAAAPLATTQAPGFYRTMVGDYELTVLSDGTVMRPIDKIMSNGDEIRQVFAKDHETLPTELSINAFLLNIGSKLILIDCGAGALFGPRSGGRLIRNLRASGYRPEQIDAVLLTHIHADHSGGLSIEGRRQFSKAIVYVDKRDVEFWLSPSQEKSAPESRKLTFRQSHLTVDPYVAAALVHTFDGATELFPGIRSVPAYGHTPGHTAYLVESKGARLLLWGDTIHAAEVQFANPEISIQYDVNRDEAMASRKELLLDCAKRGFMVGGAHISFPGLGHVRISGHAFLWIALPYASGQERCGRCLSGE
jgi:glyoxylase-like metal-dependent hydrolase (beta-lactamase superfamily II)